MLICIICQLLRSVSDYDKCCIKLKLLPVGVHSYAVVQVSVVAMATGAKK